MSKQSESENKYREKQANSYRKFRKWALDFLGGKCLVCGSTEDLHIDHIDPKQKEYKISQLHSHKKEKQIRELNKCQILCKEHHIEKTLLMRDNKYNFSINENIHGSGYMYVVKGCRCLRCSAWHYLYKKKRVQYKDVLTSDHLIEYENRQRKYLKDIVHGTRGGYLKEGRLGLDRCDACKAANTRYHQELKRKS